jgi:hypothetical protein
LLEQARYRRPGTLGPADGVTVGGRVEATASPWNEASLRALEGAVKRRPMSEPVVGIAAGYLPSRPMDKVTAAYQERQSAVSRRREKELQEEPAYVKAAERVAEIGGQNLDQERTERLGLRLHRGLGLSGGVIAGLLVARGINLGRRDPDGLRALAARRRGGQRALRVDPSSDGLSAKTHVRGLLGHLTYGGALGALLAAANALLWKRSTSEG